jgi:hypothetical protein
MRKPSAMSAINQYTLDLRPRSLFGGTDMVDHGALATLVFCIVEVKKWL